MTLVRFADIRGHQRTLSVLRRSVASERVHHAYLFSGPDGVGKRLAAQAFAALVNCLSPVGDGATLDACGTCVSCKKFASGSHPDFSVVVPDGRFIKIDQVRALHAMTRFRPYEAARRVVIVEDADTLREEAANALLKTLEEPRGDTMFVLVSSNAQKLLTTVVSRCQPLRFAALPALDVAALLAERGVSIHQAEVVGRLSGGSVGNALHALESDVWAARAEIAERLSGVRTASSGALLEWASELGGKNGNLPDVLGVFRSLVRDALLAKAGASATRFVNADLRTSIETYSSGQSIGELLGAAERIDEAEAMLRGNVNPRLVAETLLLTLADAPETPLAKRVPA